NNDNWTPKLAATGWKASRCGSDNNGVHVFFAGSDSCTGTQFATLSTRNHHHSRAVPGTQTQGHSAQQQQRGGNNQNAQQNRDIENQNQSQNQDQNNQNQQQDSRNQNEGDSNQNNSHNRNGQFQENTFSVSAGESNRRASSNNSSNNNSNNSNNVNTNRNNFNFQSSLWTKGQCFSNSGHNSWKVNTGAAFAATSTGVSNDLADMRMFYWSTSGHGNTGVLKGAYYTRGGRGKRGSGNNNNNNNNNYDSGQWKSGRLSKTVSCVNLGSLAATFWTKDGKVGRT
ncbi:hypothetical protein FRC00_011370, partial [Tulasnella sp. 408]